ncbi:MAG: DsbA family protein [Pseudonocardiaceae bacterium]
MGGAERAERKRKQQAAQAARATSVATRADKRVSRGAVGVAILALVALLVGGGFWLQSRSNSGDLPATIPVAAAGPAYPVAVEGHAVVAGQVVAGQIDAPVTIDVYEDFLCSGCGQFEQLYGDQLADAAAAGHARVVYHPVAILDENSEPPGYSTRAAGAALCAAEAGVFPRFHDSLFDTQPRGGGPGWTSSQLQQLGGALGAGEGFARCVPSSGDRVAAATDQARQYVSGLRPDGRFGTPTVLVDGAVVDTGEPGWLDEALGAAR